MAFSDAAAYDRFMGRFSRPLAHELVGELGVHPGQRAVDVGCGPGALTAELVALLGADAVAAADPSPPFVAAVRAALPGVDVRQARAESLPFDDNSADVVAASLVVHFMSDPVAGLTEMARVARSDGVVAATVWDLTGSNPLSPLWDAVAEGDPTSQGESHLPGGRPGHLAELAEQAGLQDVTTRTLTVRVGFDTFEEWWEPFTFGVGPSGEYVARLDESGREELRERCRKRLGDGPVDILADAWLVTARP